MRSILVSAAFLLAATWSGVAAAVAPGAAIDAVARREMAARGTPGMQVVVVRGRRIVHSAAYGTADLERGLPVTRETAFTLNSSTKAFTGVAIMQLVQDGQLALNSPAARYLDDLPPAWRGVTVAQLLTHTSGLPDIVVPPKGQGTGSLVGDGSDASAWATAKTLPLQGPPGMRFSYNQTNYVILGKIIERLTGQPFTRFMDARQFTPAGMRQAAFGDSRAVMPGRTRIYRYAGGAVTRGSGAIEHGFDEFAPIVRTAAGLNASAEDVARWLIALRDGRLLDAGHRATLWSPIAMADGRRSDWGLGWPLSQHGRHRVAAGIGGRRTAFFVYPDDDLAVVVTSNLAGTNPEEFVDAIARAYLPDLPVGESG